MIETCKELVRKICDCELPLVLKSQRFQQYGLGQNNIPLS